MCQKELSLQYIQVFELPKYRTFAVSLIRNKTIVIEIDIIQHN